MASCPTETATSLNWKKFNGKKFHCKKFHQMPAMTKFFTTNYFHVNIFNYEFFPKYGISLTNIVEYNANGIKSSI